MAELPGKQLHGKPTPALGLAGEREKLRLSAVQPCVANPPVSPTELPTAVLMASGIPESNENQNSAIGPLPTGCSLQTLPETRHGCKVEGRMGSPHPQEDKMGVGIGGCLGSRGKGRVSPE